MNWKPSWRWNCFLSTFVEICSEFWFFILWRRNVNNIVIYGDIKYQSVFIANIIFVYLFSSYHLVKVLLMNVIRYEWFHMVTFLSPYTRNNHRQASLGLRHILIAFRYLKKVIILLHEPFINCFCLQYHWAVIDCCFRLCWLCTI